MPSPVFDVMTPGARTTFQDLGRHGHAALGVGSSGAADLAGHRLANRLVGNDDRAVTLEVVLGGLELFALDTVLVALTGARRATDVNGRSIGFHSPFTLAAGDILRVGYGPTQVYTYLAVAGGFVAPRVLGSSSTDQLSGIGPAPLAAGTTLHAADAAAVRGHRVDIAPVPQPTEPVELVVARGPRADWFGADALAELCRVPYVVTSNSSRVALRLDGPRIRRIRSDELRSEALVPGAIQLPPDGLPIVFGADHPVTGGYPVLAVVRAADLDAAAQAHPGAQVHFRLASSRRRGR